MVLLPFPQPADEIAAADAAVVVAAPSGAISPQLLSAGAVVAKMSLAPTSWPTPGSDPSSWSAWRPLSAAATSLGAAAAKEPRPAPRPPAPPLPDAGRSLSPRPPRPPPRPPPSPRPPALSRRGRSLMSPPWRESPPGREVYPPPPPGPPEDGLGFALVCSTGLNASMARSEDSAASISPPLLVNTALMSSSEAWGAAPFRKSTLRSPTILF